MKKPIIVGLALFAAQPTRKYFRNNIIGYNYANFEESPDREFVKSLMPLLQK